MKLINFQIFFKCKLIFFFFKFYYLNLLTTQQKYIFSSGSIKIKRRLQRCSTRRIKSPILLDWEILTRFKLIYRVSTSRSKFTLKLSRCISNNRALTQIMHDCRKLNTLLNKLTFLFNVIINSLDAKLLPQQYIYTLNYLQNKNMG